MLEIHFKESDILKLKETSTKTILTSKEQKEHDEHKLQTHTVQQRKLKRQQFDKKHVQQQQKTKLLKFIRKHVTTQHNKHL